MKQEVHKRIFEDLKCELKTTVERIEYDNISEQLPRMKIAVRMLEDLMQLVPAERSQSVEEPEKQVEEFLEEDRMFLSDGNKTLIAEEKEGSSLKTNVFIRELKGGFAGHQYIGESIVRSLSLEHGDIIHVSVSDNTGKPFVTLVEKGPGKPREDRIQFSYCKVEESRFYRNRLIVHRFFNGSDFSELPCGEIEFSNEEVQKWELQSGDLVDIAYFESSPNQIQLIWKHLTKTSLLSRPLPTSKRNSDPQHIIRESSSNEYPIRGKHIVVIGADDRHPDYRDAIEANHGTFTGLKGDSRPDQVEVAVRKADVVVIVICAIRTHTAEYSPTICKSYQVPFTRVHNDGVASILRAAAFPKWEGDSKSESKVEDSIS